MSDLSEYLAEHDPIDGDIPPKKASNKRAAIYLRVSSRGQVNTDYDPEGLSLPAQRGECTQKASGSLRAEVVREYIEPGVSAKSLTKRKAFRQMLTDIQEFHDIDYVIVYSVSRWARNQEDYWVARGLINRAGAKLISVKEPIGDDTSHGVVTEGVMAAVAAGRRLEIAEEVMQGIKRKLEVGGTPGRARIGYVNIREPLPQGGEVRTVEIDPERGPLVKAAWELYGTGNYSLSDIEQIMAERGLRSRRTRQSEGKPLNAARWQELFRSDYYIGVVRYRGKVYKGRHPRLISLSTFERVQAVLDAQRLSGERDRRHSHYLKGTLYCDECGGRLMFSRNRGKGGEYDYFVCRGKQLGTCSQPYHRVDRLEWGVERCYGRMELGPSRVTQIRKVIERHVGNLSRFAEQEIEKAKRELARLLGEERKLLHQHYADHVSEALFEEEQVRIRKERAGAEETVEKLQTDYSRLLANLDQALKLAVDVRRAYVLAGPRVRRLLNQAFFKQLRIREEDVAEAVLAEPYGRLLAIDLVDELDVAEKVWEQAFGPLADQRAPAEVFEKHRTPDLALVRGSISDVMVELVGLEPTTFALPARRSPS